MTGAGLPSPRGLSSLPAVPPGSQPSILWIGPSKGTHFVAASSKNIIEHEAIPTLIKQPTQNGISTYTPT